MKLDNGQTRSIYLHYDGYPSHTLIRLIGAYGTAGSVQALLDLGNLSVLGYALEPRDGEGHSFAAPAPEVCVAYGRDRGESNQQAQVSTTLPFDTDYTYIFADDIWHVFRNGRSMSVDTALTLVE